MTVTVYPALPDTKCPEQPIPPAFLTDADLAAFLAAKDEAGQVCRDKLKAIDAVVTKWPKGS